MTLAAAAVNGSGTGPGMAGVVTTPVPSLARAVSCTEESSSEDAGATIGGGVEEVHTLALPRISSFKGLSERAISMFVVTMSQRADVAALETGAGLGRVRSKLRAIEKACRFGAPK